MPVGMATQRVSFRHLREAVEAAEDGDRIVLLRSEMAGCYARRNTCKQTCGYKPIAKTFANCTGYYGIIWLANLQLLISSSGEPTTDVALQSTSKSESL